MGKSVEQRLVSVRFVDAAPAAVAEMACSLCGFQSADWPNEPMIAELVWNQKPLAECLKYLASQCGGTYVVEDTTVRFISFARSQA